MTASPCAAAAAAAAAAVAAAFLASAALFATAKDASRAFARRLANFSASAASRTAELVGVVSPVSLER